MTRYVLLAGAVLLAASAGLFGWQRSRMRSSSISTRDVLEQVYQSSDPNLAGHQQAEMAIAAEDEILVLASANLRGAGETTWLLRIGKDGTLRWQRHLEARFGTGHAVVPLAGGGTAIAGEIQRGAMAYQGQIVHIDDDGNVLGSATLGPQGIAGLSAAVALPDGSLAAGGLAQGRGFLVRMDASLRVTWQMPLSEVEEVIGMTALASGVAVAANQEKPTARLGIGRVLVLDADHHVRWQCRVPAERRGELAGLASLPNGDLIVVGHSTAADGAKTRILVTRLGGNGVPSWAQLLGPEDQEQRGRAIVALPDGSVVAVGDALDAMNRRRILVFRLSASGTTSWERSFGGAGSDVARGITRLNDGSLVVVGSTTRHGPGKTNALILHIDEHGDLLWERSFGSAAL